uniref:SOCS box domain-containing protein n=1 Tax=Anopheles atroparvus TaxID=41427 RepID=A0AAG5CQ75_ANOAO
MHLHFEKNSNTRCDCPILSLSWMGKVPDDIPEEEGWKLNRTNYYQEGWLATGNVRGIVGVTFTTSHCKKNVEYPLRTNYNLRGHRSDVILVKWNEPYQKLASCDSSGIIFVWIKYEGRWSVELINDRNTPVTHFSWSHDGRMALICYQDGFVLVGSVAGQRYWSSMLNLDATITCGIWTPDDQQVYFGTTQGQIIVMDVHGAMVSQVPLSADVGITAMAWSCEKFKMEEGEDTEPGVTNASKRSFVLAVSFQNGYIYLLKSYDDITPSQIHTGLNGELGIVMEWSNSRELLAVAGTELGSSPVTDVHGATVYNNLLKFYTESGSLLYTAKIPNSTYPVSALTWGHNDKRIFIATGTQVHIAWVSRRVASLQLFCRLKVQSSLASEALLPRLPLPSRIKALIGSPRLDRKRKPATKKRPNSNGNDRSPNQNSDSTDNNEDLAYLDTLPELVEVTSNIWGTKFKIHGLAKTLPANLGQVTYKTSLLHLQPRQMKLVITELRDDFPTGPDPNFNPNIFSEDEEDQQLQQQQLQQQQQQQQQHQQAQQQQLQHLQQQQAHHHSGHHGSVLSGSARDSSPSGAISRKLLNESAPPIAPMSPRPNRFPSRPRRHQPSALAGCSSSSAGGTSSRGLLGPLARAESYEDDTDGGAATESSLVVMPKVSELSENETEYSSSDQLGGGPANGHRPTVGGAQLRKGTAPLKFGPGVSGLGGSKTPILNRKEQPKSCAVCKQIAPTVNSTEPVCVKCRKNANQEQQQGEADELARKEPGGPATANDAQVNASAVDPVGAGKPPQAPPKTKRTTLGQYIRSACGNHHGGDHHSNGKDSSNGVSSSGKGGGFFDRKSSNNNQPLATTASGAAHGGESPSTTTTESTVPAPSNSTPSSRSVARIVTSFTDSPLFSRRNRQAKAESTESGKPQSESNNPILLRWSASRSNRHNKADSLDSPKKHRRNGSCPGPSKESTSSAVDSGEPTSSGTATTSSQTDDPRPGRPSAGPCQGGIISRWREMEEGGRQSTPPASPARLARSSPASPTPSKKSKRHQSASPIRHILNSPLLNRRQRKKQHAESSDDENGGGSGNHNNHSSPSNQTDDSSGSTSAKQYRDLETFQKAQLRQKLKRGKIEPNGVASFSQSPAPVRREFVMHNKAPMWNENSQVYQLDFGGRVTQESAKNFQIEFRGKQVMQFGRIDGNAYTLDFQYPFSALQAFAVALANVTQRLK